MSHENKEQWKIWKGTELSIQNWHEEFGEFWTEHTKMSNICTLIDRFWKKHKMFDLKSTRTLCFRALKIDAKFERKLTCAFKNDIKIFVNFHRLRNSDFNLESKTADLNQNKNSTQLNGLDATWKLYFTLEINE